MCFYAPPITITTYRMTHCIALPRCYFIHTDLFSLYSAPKGPNVCVFLCSPNPLFLLSLTLTNHYHYMSHCIAFLRGYFSLSDLFSLYSAPRSPKDNPKPRIGQLNAKINIQINYIVVYRIETTEQKKKKNSSAVLLVTGY